jgi:hypothetical protein
MRRFYPAAAARWDSVAGGPCRLRDPLASSSARSSPTSFTFAPVRWISTRGATLSPRRGEARRPRGITSSVIPDRCRARPTTRRGSVAAGRWIMGDDDVQAKIARLEAENAALKAKERRGT